MKNEQTAMQQCKELERISVLEAQIAELQEQMSFVSTFWSFSLDAQIVDLQNELTEANKRCEVLHNLVFSTLSSGDLAKYLSQLRDYSLYFQLLPILTQRFLVILTVKDTPGDCMPTNILKNILDAKFTNFRTDLWRTYVGVIAKGEVLCDTFAEMEQRCFYTYKDLVKQDFSFTARSEPWRNGNRGDIIINGKDYAVNQRGVNIVIYDLEQRRVIDSVAFDSHDESEITFRRRGEG